jgi:hypothetical protein
MKILFPIVLLVVLLAWNSAVAQKETGPKVTSPAQNENVGNASTETSASIKILKNEKVVVEYKPSIPEAFLVTDKAGKKSIMINHGSNDNTYALLLTVEKAATGSFSIGKEGVGQVQIQLVTEGKGEVPFLTNLTEGTFKITITGESCSGTFTGAEKESGSPIIGITGNFTSIPLTKKSVNY